MISCKSGLNKKKNKVIQALLLTLIENNSKFVSFQSTQMLLFVAIYTDFSLKSGEMKYIMSA